MATTPNQNSLEQDLIELLNRRRGIEEASLDDARDLANFLQSQTRELKSQLTEKNSIRSVSRDIVKIATQTFSIQDKELGTLKGIKDLSKQRQLLEQSILTLSSLKNKIYEGDAQTQYDINQGIKEQIKSATKLNQELKALEKSSEAIAKNFGVKTFGALNDITKAIPGLQRFSEPFEKASEAARKQALINQDAFALKTGEGLTKEKIKQLGLEKQLGGLTGAAAASKAKSLGIEIKSQNTFLAGAKSLGPALAESFGPLFLLVEAFKSFLNLDKTIGDTAKQLGISYGEAAGLSQQFNNIANSSGNIFITTKGINESFNQINAALGTNANLNEELLLTQTELTKQAFYSVEAATEISKLSLATDQSSKDIVTSFLGQAKALNLVNNTAINEKQLVEGISKTSKGILATFAAQPKKLIETFYAVKKVGLELESMKGIQDSLLNIESSIAAEFEAEVLTGKQLNLERARYYALTNNLIGLSQELTNQGIDQAKFAGMNVLQQESVAQAMGLSRDQLGGMLLEQAALSKLTKGDTEENRKQLAILKEKGFSAEAIAELGQEEFDRQKASASIQDRFNASIEKLKELLVSIIEPLMPILDVFTNILKVVGLLVQGVQYLGESLGGVGGILVGIIPLLLKSGLLMRSFALFGFKGAIAAIFRTFAEIPFGLGIPLAAGAIIGLNQLLSSSPPGLAKGGTVTRAGSIMVGENGPEILSAKPGATVTPLTKVNAATVENPQSTAIIDYEKLAQVMSRVTVQSNLDGVAVSSRLQTPMGIATRKI
jgi:hypothetical protein